MKVQFEHRNLRMFGNDCGQELLLEPGVALTADVMHFASRLIDFINIRSRWVPITPAAFRFTASGNIDLN